MVFLKLQGGPMQTLNGVGGPMGLGALKGGGGGIRNRPNATVDEVKMRVDQNMQMNCQQPMIMVPGNSNVGMTSQKVVSLKGECARLGHVVCLGI